MSVLYCEYIMVQMFIIHVQEKKEEILLSPIAKAFIPTEISKQASGNTKTQQTVYYTLIADRLWTLSFSNYSHSTGVIKPLYGHQPSR